MESNGQDYAIEVVEENLVGLNRGAVRQVKFVLTNVCGDGELGEYYKYCVLHIERIVSLIMCEINSTKKDLAYWEGLSSASSLEMAYMHSQMYVYRLIFGESESHKVHLSSRFHMTKEKIEKVLRRLSTVMTRKAHATSTIKEDNSQDNFDGNQSINQLQQPESHGFRSSALSLSSMPDPNNSHKIFDNVEKHIFVLRFDLHQLACMLASVKESADHLKRIFNEVAVTTQRTVTSRAKHQPSFLHPQLAEQFHSFAREKIKQSLRDLSSTLKTYDLQSVSLQNVRRPLAMGQSIGEMTNNAYSRFWSLVANWTPMLDRFSSSQISGRAKPGESRLATNKGYEQLVSVDAADEEMIQIEKTFREVNTLLRGLKDGEYPLQITDAYARRPSRLERLWLRDFFVLAACAGAASKLLGMYKDGTLKRMYVSCVEVLAHGVKDHVIEPLTDLSRYLFERIKDDAELIVTRKELMQSKEELKAMLDGYRKLYGLELPKSSMKSQISNSTGSVDSQRQPVTGAVVRNRAEELRAPNPVEQPGTASSNPSSSHATPQPTTQEGDVVVTGNLSENSMLPVVAKSLKRATDSASATIDSILRAMQETRDALSSTEVKPDLTDFDINISKTMQTTESPETMGSSAEGSQKTEGLGQTTTNGESSFVIEDANIDKAMDSLMNKYIQEIESPLRGVLFGSVVTAALIQMQKIKVMTEAAMMRMDQVLASNQLTMAGTAAMPAFVLISGVGFLVRKMFSSSPPSQGEKTLRLRLALTNVERSLQVVYSAKAGRSFPSPDLPLERSKLSWEEDVASPRRIRERNSSDQLLEHPLNSPLYKKEHTQALPSSYTGHQTKSTDESSITFDVDRKSSPPAAEMIDTSDGESATDVGTPTPRSVDLHSITTGRPRANTFKYTENNMLINRGNLCFDIIVLRNELSGAFSPRYQRNLVGISGGPGPRLHYRPHQSFMRLLYRMLFGEVSDFDDELEYQAIIHDVTLLEAPDDEVDGLKKMSIATRMRSSYRCFNI